MQTEPISKITNEKKDKALDEAEKKLKANYPVLCSKKRKYENILMK